MRAISKRALPCVEREAVFSLVSYFLLFFPSDLNLVEFCADFLSWVSCLFDCAEVCRKLSSRSDFIHEFFLKSLRTNSVACQTVIALLLGLIMI